MSPVMARSPRTGPPENADTSAATIVTGRRPFRRLRARPHVQMHVGVPMESRVEALSSGVGPRPRQRDSHRLLHGLPRRPVRVSALEPGIRVASTETTSQPPAAVRHSPPATPGRPARRATSPSGCAGAPCISTTVSGVTSITTSRLRTGSGIAPESVRSVQCPLNHDGDRGTHPGTRCSAPGPGGRAARRPPPAPLGSTASRMKTGLFTPTSRRPWDDAAGGANREPPDHRRGVRHARRHARVGEIERLGDGLVKDPHGAPCGRSESTGQSAPPHRVGTLFTAHAKSQYKPCLLAFWGTDQRGSEQKRPPWSRFGWAVRLAVQPSTTSVHSDQPTTGEAYPPQGED